MVTTPDMTPLSWEEFFRELRHYATKEDLANMKADLIKWMVGSMLGFAGLVSAVVFALQKL